MRSRNPVSSTTGDINRPKNQQNSVNKNQSTSKRLILILVAVALIVTGVLVWRTREAQAHQHVLQACTVQVKKVTTAQAGSHDES